MATTMTRRQALSLLAVTTSGTLIGRDVLAQASATEGALITGADICVITPQVAEGPFYFDPALERSDVTDGRPGMPTAVRLQIVDEQCRPLPGARVDIWHCDALGLYSGYPNQLGGVDTTGERFMRGTQFADDRGVVEFATVYPGWYPGRTPHIHFKIFVAETTVLVGQLFFPDEVSDRIYAMVAPYTQRSGRDTFNAGDGIARRAGAASVAEVEELPESYLAQMIIGIAPRV
jgi:protocatechuate 3,4-dioxygenase beta subunit